MRQLGFARRLLVTEASEPAARLRTSMLTEMVTRVVKNYLRAQLRRVHGTSADDYAHAAVDVFNLVFGKYDDRRMIVCPFFSLMIVNLCEQSTSIVVVGIIATHRT